MVNVELTSYIRASLERGHSQASIQNELRNAGWPASDIDAAFREVAGGSAPQFPMRNPGSPVQRGPAIGGPSGLAGGSGTGFHAKFFQLQDGENIVFESKPAKGLFRYMLATSIFGLVFLTFILSIFFAPVAFIVFAILMVFAAESSALLTFLLGALFLFIILFALDFIFIRRAYNMRYYWVTTNRIITKQGTIGYSINSIPLERISDVLISRSFKERIFGFGSLYIQSLAGQYTPGGKLGSEGNLTAVPNPEQVQALIFNLVKQRREQAHLTM